MAKGKRGLNRNPGHSSGSGDLLNPKDGYTLKEPCLGPESWNCINNLYNSRFVPI